MYLTEYTSTNIFLALEDRLVISSAYSKNKVENEVSYFLTTSLVSGNNHQPLVPVAMVMVPIVLSIRHVFADAPMTEASIGAAPPGK